ncbi:MAG: hypothetical protein KatS3mg115_1990 [Candidatus Poribacteria bacterium]|nr:MAG: hypothetical protein KatS3mg115_1990 [Candidatus Poribacteria bacterium]
MSRLDAAEVLRFLPNRSSLEPVLRLRLWDGTPPDGFTEIAFGPPEREGRTVRSSRRPGAIGVVSEELFHDWPLDPAAYRDRTALQLDLGAVQRVEVVRGARRAAWVREGLTWRVAEPAGAVGGSDALEELLGLLERLRVERWSARPPSEGWSPPYGSVRVVLRNLQERRLLHRTAG